MKRLSLVLILAILLAALGFSTVFARSDSPGAAGPGVQASNMASSGCWGIDLQGQVKSGRLFAGPGFNLSRWLSQNPEITLDQLVLAIGSTGQNGCVVWILPSQ